MKQHERRRRSETGAGGLRFERPEFLPPPTELPLRHCKHNEEGTVIEEHECLVDLLGGEVRGNQVPKNKQHFVLADAPEIEAQSKMKSDDRSRKRKRDEAEGLVDVRELARAIPGVPIVYVKRSVMVLEEMSGASLGIRGKGEREKLREGLIGGAERKRKRGEEDEESEEERRNGQEGAAVAAAKQKAGKKVKAPNPLSVMKKKVKPPKQSQSTEEGIDGSGGGQGATTATTGSTEMPKAKRKRKHKARKAEVVQNGTSQINGRDTTSEPDNGIQVAHSRLQEILA